MYFRIFRQKASTMYRMMGDPMVRTDAYIKYCRILLVAIPIRWPMAEQTPKAFHSTKFRILCILLI